MNEENYGLPDSEKLAGELDEINELLNSDKKAAPEPPKKSAEEKRFGQELFGWVQAVVTALAVIVILFVFFVRIMGVSGPSMETTFFDGDQIILLNKTIAKYDVGDVVVFVQESYSTDPLIKRVIATEGQTVDINFETGEVFVDGVLTDYTDEPTLRQYDVTFPQTVEEGKIFVLGDNRNNSIDSRYGPIGQIDRRSVLGKVWRVVYPFNRFGEKP